MVKGMAQGVHRGPPRRLRVLVEAPAPYSLSVKEAAQLSDCEIVHCRGPLTGHQCPVLAGVPCPSAAAADVVVASLGLSTEQDRSVLDGLKSLHPDVPLVVLAWQADLESYHELLEGCHAVTFPWTLRKLRAAVQDAAFDVQAPVEARRFSPTLP